MMLRLLTVLCLLCLLARPACAQDAGAEADHAATVADSIALLINIYQEHANTAAEAEDYNKAISWELKALETVEEYIGKESQEYALILGLIAAYLNETGEYGKALNLGTQAVNILARHTDETDENYNLLLQNRQLFNDNALNLLNDYRAQADSAVSRGNFQEAIHMEQAAGQLIKDAEGESTGYALSLNQQSIYYGFQQDYATAIDLVSQAMQVWEQCAATDDPNYRTMGENLAYYDTAQKSAFFHAKADSAFQASDYRTAIQWETEALNQLQTTIGKQNVPYISTLNNLSIYHFHLGECPKAIQFVEETLELQKETVGEESIDYATYLENLAEYKAALGDYTTAISLNRQALETRKKLQGERHPSYAETLRKLSKYYFNTGDARTAAKLCSQALEIQAEMEGRQSISYALSIGELARYNEGLGNLPEAIRLGKESLELQRTITGENNANYCSTLNNLAQFYSNAGNYQEAIRLGEQALVLQEKIIGTGHPDYARSLSNIATSYAALGNFPKAIQLTQEARTIWKKSIGENHPDYATALNNLAMYYSNIGNYEEAIRLEAEALLCTEKTLGKEHPGYATLLNNMGTYNAALGNYQEAIEQYVQTLRIRKAAFGETHPDIAQSLQNLGNIYYELGNYEESIRLTRQAADIFKETLGERHSNYASALNNIGLSYLMVGDHQQAFNYGMQAMEIQKETLGDSHPSLAINYSNLALLADMVKADSAAVIFITAAIEIQKENGLEKHANYAKALGILAQQQFKQGKHVDAINLKRTALKVMEEAVGKQHPNYISELTMLADYYKQLRRPETPATCEEVSQLLTDNIRRTFAYLTKTERTQFWLKNRYWFTPFIHQAARDFPSDSLTANAYNGLLLSKGLLLNSEIELSTLLAESGDKEVETLYDDLRNLRLQLNKLYEQPVAERALSTDSLEREAQRMERALVQRSKVYGDFTRNLAIDWQQVQEKLKAGDVAVEFVSFPVAPDSVLYAAYCLRPGDAAPQRVPLFEEKQLKAVGATHYYDRPDVARLVWQPLADELAGAERVYFAPDGELYNIAIESVPHWADSLLVSDHWQFYRLSSTRQLAVVRDGQSADEAALYGGLRYDTDVTTMVNDSRRHPARTRAADISLFNLADSLNLRSGLQDLPATRVEAEEILARLRQTSTQPTLYTDTLGTEASFKALSGRRTRLMHIATHGFYWTEREAQAVGDRLAFLAMDNAQPRYVEDKALTRSGLFFAGANHTLEGESLPEGVDDGILTAREISTLDLRGLDLVALSACQTGLGEITGDGVFGLQRGFKKAGAGTLLMSLWKVDDQATQLLMTRFYANLVGGKSKAESLREAQRYVREYEVEQEATPADGRRPLSAQARQQAQQQRAGGAQKRIVRPYANPRFWAAFILLDALD